MVLEMIRTRQYAFVLILLLLFIIIQVLNTNQKQKKLYNTLESTSNLPKPHTSNVKETSTSDVPREFVKIDLNGPYEYRTPDNDTRTLYPSCSGGPYIGHRTPKVATNPQYSFYMQQGDQTKVLFRFAAGGACWNALTCLIKPSYNVAEDTNRDKINTGNVIGDMNIYHNYTIIYIPYCTGDTHLGSRDKEYIYQESGQNMSWTIKHRGFDNFLSVLSYLSNKYKWFNEVEHLSIMGSSAGGGVIIFALPYFIHAMPQAKINVISDSMVGVTSRPFFKTALWNPEDQKSTSWGMQRNLPTWMGMDEDYMNTFTSNPSNFMPFMLKKYCNTFPKIKAAMITSNQDEVQIYFYFMMRLEEDPLFTRQEAAAEWYSLMSKNLKSLEDVDNYRSYVMDGKEHCILNRLKDWVSYMVEDVDLWQTVDAGSPFD